MSLGNKLAKGVIIKGLTAKRNGVLDTLLTTTGVAGGDLGETSDGVVQASYSFERNLFSSNVVTVFMDRNGNHPITVLPYRPGAINTCTPTGTEVLSGPFTGCFMALYRVNGGELKCGHIDTSEADNAKPSKDRWETMANKNVLAEGKSTVSDALFKDMAKTGKGANGGFCLGLATLNPAKVRFFRVVYHGDDLKVTGED